MTCIAEPPPQEARLDYYQNAEGWKPTATATLTDMIEAIRGDEYAATVAEIRTLIAAGKKPEADAVKKGLPALSLSGTIDGRRKQAVQEGRFTHSGLLQIDLDAKDNIGWSIEEMRDVLMADPRMVAVYITPSGNGVKGVARIPASASSHLRSFLAAEAHFRSLNLVIDKSCKDPVRLCFVSHDPNAWLCQENSAQFEPLPVTEMVDVVVMADDEPVPAPCKHSVTISETGGLILRETHAPMEVTPAVIRDMLRHIPYPGYEGWIRVTNAVWREVGIEEGTAILQEWAPEKREGDYAAHARYPMQDVTIGTVIMMAKENGWAPSQPVSAVLATPTAALTTTAAPEASVAQIKAEVISRTDEGKTIGANIFPVPNGNIGNDLAANHICAVIGPTNRLFMRGGTVYEVATDESDDSARLAPLHADRFTSLIETFGAKVMILENRDEQTLRWRSTTLGENHCRMILASNGARTHLPPIRQLAASPVLIPDGKYKATTLGHGWNPHAGGTFVTGKDKAMPHYTFEQAMEVFAQLVTDFNFPTLADASRAVASFLSPAMKLGRWIEDDFPIDVAEADQSQAGKSYRHKLIAAIYGETPYQITNSTGGVGSLDERIAGALIAGRPIIVLENIRGRMDSQLLESAIRGVGRVTARSFRACVEVDASPFLWQLSTNGAELTRDLANRAIITRIRKQPDGYQYAKFREGHLLDHVRANQPKFLASIHAIIREWASHGCPRSAATGHDFRTWVQSMDWIVQHLFELPPLLEGHRDEQLRTANPKLQWLRDILHAILTHGHDTQFALTASDLAEAAEEHDIPIPGRRHSAGDTMEQAVGKVMSKLFRDASGETITVDGRRLTRQLTVEYDPMRKENRERKSYVIEPD